MKKIVFIEPKSPSLHIFSVFGIPRLGTILLATILSQKGYDCSVYIEDISEIDFSEVLSADLVGISAITSTAPRSYEIAKRVQEHGIPVVMGGPHVTFLPEEALQYCDFVIRGEAENTIDDFVKAVENDKGLEKIPGLSFRKGEMIVHNPEVAERTDLNQIPQPDFKLVTGRTSNKSMTVKRIMPIQTSRGCPFGCTFCSVTGMFGRKMRYREIDKVMHELRQFDRKRDFIFFYDDNFNARPKRTKEIMQRMIDENLNLKWSAQVRIDVAKDKELLKLMQDSGCEHLYIGFETVSDEGLSLVKKAQTKLEMTLAIRAIHKHKIGIHGMFIFGLDTDTVQTTRNTCRFAMQEKLRTVQYLIMTPLPGSKLYDQMKADKRIIVDDWSFFDGHHVVHAPAKMSVADLQWAQLWAHKKYYSFWESVRSLLRLDFYRALVQQYAKKTNKQWIRENRLYFKAIKLQNKAEQAISRKKSNTQIRLELSTSYFDIRDRIEKAWANLRPARIEGAEIKPEDSLHTHHSRA